MIQGGDLPFVMVDGIKLMTQFGEGCSMMTKVFFQWLMPGPTLAAVSFYHFTPTPWLNGHHAIFGKVVEGMDIVRLIGVVPTDFRDRPKDPVIMETAEVIK